MYNYVQILFVATIWLSDLFWTLCRDFVTTVRYHTTSEWLKIFTLRIHKKGKKKKRKKWSTRVPIGIYRSTKLRYVDGTMYVPIADSRDALRSLGPFYAMGSFICRNSPAVYMFQRDRVPTDAEYRHWAADVNGPRRSGTKKLASVHCQQMKPDLHSVNNESPRGCPPGCNCTRSSSAF